MLIVLSGFLLAGCGDSNPQVTFDSLSGKHQNNWLPSGHTAEAKAHPESCADCHGSDFLGGVSKVACTQCHLGNPNSIHPVRWGNFAYALHGIYVRANGTSSCANIYCHGANLQGVAGSGPSCTQCHLGGPTSVHPAAWDNNIALHKDYVGSNGTTSCRNTVCHGANLQGVFLSGPACAACHPAGP
jgi:hypothetical protein